MGTARQAWIAARPYLVPVARFQEVVDGALEGRPGAGVPPPPWESYAADHAAGVPLLHSASAGPAVIGASADALGAVTERVAAAAFPGRIGEACRQLRDALRSPADRMRAAQWVVAGAAGAPAHAGLVRLLGWAAVRHVIAALVEGAAPWREEAGWGRAHCPTCGSLPSMAHLASGGGGRPRFLACACCRTRWRYRRIGCPFCGNEAADRLAILELEGEGGVRLDACEACKGYVKTYAGDGDEELFLADWPTLHLDVLARDRGFERLGASLYEI